MSYFTFTGVKNRLITNPGSSADPATPESTRTTQFFFNSNDASNCSYQIDYDSGAPKQFFPYETSVLEGHESVNGVACEKWSNNETRPYNDYWAVWYEVGSYEKVARARYRVAPIGGGFPVPGFTVDYDFSHFSTGAVPSPILEPPSNWQDLCVDLDGGIEKHGVPNRQDGYICVGPNNSSTFSLRLATKPRHTISVNIGLCEKGDGCIDGLHCKDCVIVSPELLHFSPENWDDNQEVKISYGHEGDSQFKISSPDYFLNNSFSLQFSTCACSPGKVCSNNCQAYCGR
jgi:hypothetical protein